MRAPTERGLGTLEQSAWVHYNPTEFVSADAASGVRCGSGDAGIGKIRDAGKRADSIDAEIKVPPLSMAMWPHIFTLAAFSALKRRPPRSPRHKKRFLSFFSTSSTLIQCALSQDQRFGEGFPLRSDRAAVLAERNGKTG